MQVAIEIIEVDDPNQGNFYLLKLKYIFHINSYIIELVGFYLPGSGNPQMPLLSQREKQIKRYTLEIFGQGGDGALRLNPSLIDFNIVKVGFNSKIYATLENVSDCTFFVELNIKPTKLFQNSIVGFSSA